MFASCKKRVRQLLGGENAPISVENLLTLAIVVVVSLVCIRLIGGSTHEKFHSASEAVAPEHQLDRN